MKTSKGFIDDESCIMYKMMSGSGGYINPDDVQSYTGASVHAFYISQLLFSTIYKWAGNPGGSSTNKNDVGGPPGSTHEVYDEIVVKSKGPRWYNKLWNWVKGWNFHFDWGTEVTYGLQAGLEGTLGRKRIGADVNLISMVIAEVKTEGLVGENIPGNTQGEIHSYYWGKDGVDRLKHKLSGGAGVVGVSGEHTWEPNQSDHNHKTTLSGSILMFEGETTLQESSIPNPTRRGFHINLGGRAAFLIGIDFRIRIGITRD